MLKGGKARIFWDGNPLVYGGAVDRIEGPRPGAGDLVTVLDGHQNPLGWGAYNPRSIFRVRLLQTAPEFAARPELGLDLRGLLRERTAAAVRLRRSLGLPRGGEGATDAYRLINSEGDHLSGLVVDALGPSLVVLSGAAWVERHRAVVEEVLREEAGPQFERVVWRRSKVALGKEGALKGASGGKDLHRKEAPEVPADSDVETPEEESKNEENEAIIVRERGLKFFASAETGQKTGFYADQRENRALIQTLAGKREVLDLCCYSGGFSLSAAAGGATCVTGVDTSGPAVDLARRNAVLNGFSDVCEFLEEDAAHFMRAAYQEDKRWDLIILDPPKLAPSAKALPKALRKYKKLNRDALRLLRPGGVLLTCTCSGAVTKSGKLPDVVKQAAIEAGREVRWLQTLGAAPDHPVNLAYEEGGAYLTAGLVSVV